MNNRAKNINKIHNIFKKENIFYTFIFFIALAFLIVNRAINGFDNIIWIADIGSFFGILYVIFSAKHSIFGLIFNLISTLFIAAVTFLQAVYFNSFFCIAIGMPLLILGIIRWKRNSKKGDKEGNLKSLNKKQIFMCLILFTVALPIIMVILFKLNSTLFYLDAIATSFCLIGLILVSNMFIEQFYFFMPANLVLSTMYIILSFSNINNLSFALMYLCFFVVSIMGVINWKRLVKEARIKKELDNGN